MNNSVDMLWSECWYITCQQESLTDPSLQDLSERYGFTSSTTTSEVQQRLKEEEERIRKDIQKELKIKEGAETSAVHPRYRRQAESQT